MVSRQASEHQHRGEVEHEGAQAVQAQLTRSNACLTRVPLGPAPLEQDEHREEEDEEQRDPGPQAARHRLHAAARSGARTAS